MVVRLVESLLRCSEVGQVLVTRNIPEDLEPMSEDRVRLIDNPSPKGFGANHNAAFRLSDQPFFCVLNPDVELLDNPFSQLVAGAQLDRSGIVAPLVVTPEGTIEDSVRHFPSPWSLAKKILVQDEGRYRIDTSAEFACPEWVAGMFMLFPAEVYRVLDGFDENFFLYYEDVDICVRTWQRGLKVVLCPDTRVVHDARRDSHRSFRHLRWHVASMARYLAKHWGRLPVV